MLWCLLSVILFFGDGVLALSERPNIVFIVADDMGWHDTGFNGGDVKTPNLDAMAAQGVILSRHYTAPSCTPSRTALMTGRYPIRSGMQNALPSGVPKSLPLSEKIFPQYFHELGYKSHLVGKWHLGYRTPKHLPTRRGFDSFFGILNGFVSYYDGAHTEGGVTGRDVWRNEAGAALEVYGRYFPRVLTDEAITVINNHPGQGGLLMFLMHTAPHTGNLAYPRESPPGLPANATNRQILRETVKELDKSVGKVVTALKKRGMLNNSIIVFFSDNGAPTTDELYHYDNYGSNWPLRGEKLSNRDGGVRTPSFVWSPALSENARVSQQLFHVSDWLPTLYTAAGGKLSDISGSVALDGVDQWQTLTSSATPPRSELLVDMNDLYQMESYMLGKWKLIRDPPSNQSNAFAIKFFGDSGTDFFYDEIEVSNSKVAGLLPRPKVSYAEVRQRTALKPRCSNAEEVLRTDCHSSYCLYDILEDPTECTDLASKHPDIVQQLARRLEDYKKVMVPTQGYSFDPRADPKNWNDYWSPWIDNDVPSGACPTPFLNKFLLLLLTVNILPYFFS